MWSPRDVLSRTTSTSTLATPASGPWSRASSIPSLTSNASSIEFDAAVVNNKLLIALLQPIGPERVLSTLVRVARKAGEMMLAADPSVNTSETKNNSSDRVTATDKAVEAMVHDELTKAYPDFDFLGEESFKDGQKLSDTPTFVCDPIDGTLNFCHGFPNTAISLAVTISKKPVIGVVYNPFRGDMFTAIKGRGAHLERSNGVKMSLPLQKSPAPLKSLNDCLVAVEWGNQRQGSNWQLRTDIAMKLMTAKSEGGAMCHSLRSLGSAALDFCYVAAGWFDAFWEGGVWVWDICAGWIILEEAGGIVASANPGDWEPAVEGRVYFAVRGAEFGQKEVVEELWSLMGDRKFKY